MSPEQVLAVIQETKELKERQVRAALCAPKVFDDCNF